MSIDVNADYPTPISRDLAAFCTGKKIGEGIGRTVYQWPFDDSLVLKIETSGFQNIREYEIWDEIKDQPKYAKYFAPCVNISPCGIYLLQKKTIPLNKSEYPAQVPTFFFDRKYDNYGFLIEGDEKRFVVHDYGTFSLCNGYSLRKVKADWWE